MYKILLADDNPIILRRFSSLLDWEVYGFSLAAAAIDGMEAWQFFNQYEPEVVITDIQMPIMTGIELAKKILDKKPDTILLFLTSYEEFSYLKSAVDLGIYTYILKHEINRERMISILETLKMKLERRKIKQQFYNLTLADILQNCRPGSFAEEIIPHGYSICFPDKYYLLLITQNHIIAPFSEFTPWKTEPVSDKEMRIFCQHYVPSLTALTRLDPYQFLFLFPHESVAADSCFELKKLLHEHLSGTFSLMILCESAPITQCAQTLCKKQTFQYQSFFFPRSSIHHLRLLDAANMSTAQTFSDIPLPHTCTEHFCDKIAGNLLHSIDTLNFADFYHLINRLFPLLLDCHKRIADFQSGKIFFAYEENSMKNWYDASSLFHWINERLQELTAIFSKNMNITYSDTVRASIEYICSNYSDSDLSADQIAANLGISLNRLNEIFKQDTGNTIWKLIIRIRMERARELLRCSNEKISGICQKTGYKNTSYFTKTFRETYGIAPAEYRRGCHED